MKPSQIINLITSRIKAGVKRTILIEGSPGIGKTQIAAQAAKELGIEFHAIHVPLLQPEDYGFPVNSLDRKSVSFLVSAEKFPVEGSNFGEKGILLLDEISQCDSNTQKIIANFAQTKEIHGKFLKPGWSIVATGNRAKDRAGAIRLLSHLRDRVTAVTLELSLDDWTNWALNNGVKTEVISFIRFRPDLLSNFSPDQEDNATPRSWVEGISDSLGILSPDLEFQAFSGDVGKGPAAEFLAFLKIYRELPNLDAILLNPENSPVPENTATLYALGGALVHKTSENNFSRVLKYVERIPAEFQVLFVRDLIQKLPKIAESKEFIQLMTSEIMRGALL